jgi:hypothetical protein
LPTILIGVFWYLPYWNFAFSHLKVIYFFRDFSLRTKVIYPFMVIRGNVEVMRRSNMAFLPSLPNFLFTSHSLYILFQNLPKGLINTNSPLHYWRDQSVGLIFLVKMWN